MNMVGKHADGDCLERMAILDNLVDFPQVLNVAHEEITRSVCERNGEEVYATLDSRSSVLGHDCWTSSLQALHGGQRRGDGRVDVGRRVRAFAHPTTSRSTASMCMDMSQSVGWVSVARGSRWNRWTVIHDPIQSIAQGPR